MLQAPVVGVAGGDMDVLVDARVGLGGDDLGQGVAAGESLQFDGAGPLLAGFAVRAVGLRAMPAESRFIPIIRTGLVALRAVVPIQTGGGDHRRPTICGMLPEPIMLVFEVPVDDVVGQLRSVGRRIVRRRGRRQPRRPGVHARQGGRVVRHRGGGAQQACQGGQQAYETFHFSSYAPSGGKHHRCAGRGVPCRVASRPGRPGM